MRIFISYSKNREAVESLAKDLQDMNPQYRAWLDRKLVGGHQWWDQILENIRACDLFIFALTPDSLKSEPCRLERAYAVRLGKIILPVLMMDGVSTKHLPDDLARTQFVDYRFPDSKMAYAALTKAINELPPPRPLPNPLPPPPQVPISEVNRLKARVDARGQMTEMEQKALVIDLKQHMAKNAEDVEDIVYLLKELRRRDDLLNVIAQEIDQVLAAAPPTFAAGQGPGPQQIPGPGGYYYPQQHPGASSGGGNHTLLLIGGGLLMALVVVVVFALLLGAISGSGGGGSDNDDDNGGVTISDSPAEVTEDFLRAVASGNLDSARQYVCPATRFQLPELIYNVFVSVYGVMPSNINCGSSGSNVTCSYTLGSQAANDTFIMSGGLVCDIVVPGF